MENRFTNMERRENLRGMSIALIGGIFWGLAGVFGQYLFEYKGTNARWLVSVRLIIAGLLLLSTVWIKQRDTFWKIWTRKRDVLTLLLFSVFGIGGMPAFLLYGSRAFQCRYCYCSAVYCSGHDPGF